jgi:hypothetical protein
LHFGKPQLIAALLLLAFVLQCVWLMAHAPLAGTELQYHASEVVPSAQHSPLTNLLATVPARILRVAPDASSPALWAIMRCAFTAVGLLLGAAVWYIARRLYGNGGGYIALALYCFSPAAVAHSSTVGPEIVSACGAFGMMWTAIATAHTLYAPREVVLWNWKRIVLLGVTIALGVGGQFAVALLLILALAFMFYLVPHRIAAAAAIMGSGCVVALPLLLVVYGFHFGEFGASLAHASWAEWSGETIGHAAAWKMVGIFVLGNSPGFALLLVISLMAFATWRHTRYFGTWAPLVTMAVLVVLTLLMPRAAGFSFLLLMLPFALVFVAGVCADLLAIQNMLGRSLITGVVIAVLITHALFSLVGLRHLSTPPPASHPAGGTPHATIHPQKQVKTGQKPAIT